MAHAAAVGSWRRPFNRKRSGGGVLARLKPGEVPPADQLFTDAAIR